MDDSVQDCPVGKGWCIEEDWPWACPMNEEETS